MSTSKPETFLTYTSAVNFVDNFKFIEALKLIGIFISFAVMAKDHSRDGTDREPCRYQTGYIENIT